ncbi:hypothetical protein ACYSNM_01210 [Myroides sp. LJL116]
MEVIEFLQTNVTSDKLFMDLVTQVQKDLQITVDSDIHLQCSTANELVVELTQYLHQVLNSTNVARFSSFLYRVDVKEKDVKSIQATDIEMYVDRVVYLVLRREFQKVYLKNTFSK